MEIINPDEEPLDWDKGGKKRRPDNNPWHPPGKERNPYEKDPYPSGPFPGDPPNPDDDWPGRKKDKFNPRKHDRHRPYPDAPYPGDPPNDPWPGRKDDDYPPRRQKDTHRHFEPPGKKTCPGCGGSGEVDHPPYPPTPWHGEPDHDYPTDNYHDYPTGPTKWEATTHRGQQFGRKGHFGSGTGQ